MSEYHKCKFCGHIETENSRDYGYAFKCMWEHVKNCPKKPKDYEGVLFSTYGGL